jgi:glycosyltransferase involved in cell wall biosynthesis
VTVSILLPVFNGAATLGRALDSVRAQTFSEWELIAIDDGSTDDTTNILENAARADPRIRPMIRPHRGIVAALNEGLSTARGEYVARIDADDESLPQRLTEQVAVLRSQPEIGLVGCLVEYGGDRTAALGSALHVEWINSLTSPDEIALNRFVESPLAHPSVMFRRELVCAAGGYRSGEFPEDYELWLRLLDAGVRMTKVPQPLVRWNDPPHRLSRTDSRYSPEAFYELKAAWIERHLRTLAPLPVWIWGAGRPTRKRAAHLLAHGVTIAGYIDIDPKKIGRPIGSLPVLSPDQIPACGTAIILGYVSSRGARDLIRTSLFSRGYVEGRDFLMCA